MFTTICALSHYAAKLRVGLLLAVSPLLTLPLGAQTPHFTFNGAAASEGLGRSVAGAGDVNQDGFADVIVGANQASPGGRGSAGSAYVYSGKDGNLLWQFDGAAVNDQLGHSVAGAGDVNQDGFADVIVGASGADPGGRSRAGSAYVYSGKDGTKLWQFDGAADDDYLGWSVAGAGDVNQDGFADVIVGAYTASPGGRSNAGSAYVYSGKDGTKLWQLDGAAADDYLGISVAGAGDVNQDRFDNVIVGAYRANPGGTPDAGSAYVYTIVPASFSVFGNGCSGSVGTPELHLAQGGQVNLPLIGETFNIQLSGMPIFIFNVPFGILGFSKTQWGGIPLPYDLSNLGFWNCTQFVSLDFSIGLVNNGGVATWAIPVPNNPNLIGLTFYVQGVVIDLGVNPGDAILTNAAEGVIGG